MREGAAVPRQRDLEVVGALLGIGLLRGGKGIRWRVAGNIASGWVTTPIISCALCFVALFFLQNVFNQEVFRDSPYEISAAGIERLQDEGIEATPLSGIVGIRYESLAEFKDVLEETLPLTTEGRAEVLEVARIESVTLSLARLYKLNDSSLSIVQRQAVIRLSGRSFDHRWELVEALAAESEDWRSKPAITLNKLYNRELEEKRQELYLIFATQ